MSLMPTVKERHNARKHVKYALKTGRITKEPCDVCGSIEVEAHHPDHRQKLVVLWLCRICHLELHRHIGF